MYLETRQVFLLLIPSLRNVDWVVTLRCTKERAKKAKIQPCPQGTNNILGGIR